MYPHLRERSPSHHPSREIDLWVGADLRAPRYSSHATLSTPSNRRKIFSCCSSAVNHCAWSIPTDNQWRDTSVEFVPKSIAQSPNVGRRTIFSPKRTGRRHQRIVSSRVLIPELTVHQGFPGTALIRWAVRSRRGPSQHLNKRLVPPHPWRSLSSANALVGFHRQIHTGKPIEPRGLFRQRRCYA